MAKVHSAKTAARRPQLGYSDQLESNDASEGLTKPGRVAYKSRAYHYAEHENGNVHLDAHNENRVELGAISVAKTWRVSYQDHLDQA